MMMKKLLLTTLLTMLAMIAMAFTAYADTPIRVTVDGQEVVFYGQGPVIVDGRTLVPVRGVFEKLGFVVSWDEQLRAVTLEGSPYYAVELTIGSDMFTTNGTYYNLDVYAQIIEGSTMLPIRAVLESAGFNVDWDAHGQTVLVTTANLNDMLFELVNQTRVENGLAALAWHYGAADVLGELSQDFYNHTRHGVALPETDMYARVQSMRIGNSEPMLMEGLAFDLPALRARTALQNAMANWISQAIDLGLVLGYDMTHFAAGFYNDVMIGEFIVMGDLMDGLHDMIEQSDISPDVLYGLDVDDIIGGLGSLQSQTNPQPAPPTQDYYESAPNPQTPYESMTPAQRFALDVFELVNEMRAQYGIAPLAWNSYVAQASQSHSQDMANNATLAHMGSDGSDPIQRLERLGLQARGIGENVARGQRTPEAVITSWMNSPGHRGNILNPEFTHIGVGFYSYFWTKKFVTIG